ncbi:hypothetical protein BIT28_10975 [Photobacterium proteolyticum]|uniref:Lipoprotein n=1 Tax=Photobacterium proteolyticum TaxID=1903952 RepID=A0A1Q9G6Z7_9GAMM|nr:hypothetical protein [Photobacterium proteolyticum]OLQ70051.1 hypothetical protein BIT28_10975 [Photobacterium proteolyticum]
MKTSIKISLLASILASLYGCGGGSDDSNSKTTPSTVNVQGKAIDGYISGATVYLDLNFNNYPDSNEPSVVTADEGDFSLSIPASYQKCVKYVPLVVDVPVGAVDSDFPGTPIEEAYSMVFPPQFALSTDQDLLNLTPLTSVVWKQVEQELRENQAHSLSCESMVQEQALLDDIKQRLVEQEWRVANRYNITVGELYGDYVAADNAELHKLAQDFVPGLQKSYEETRALIKQYPDAELAWVEYFLGQWDSNNKAYDSHWYRYEFVQASAGNFSSETHVMSDDLQTKLTLHDKNSMVTTQSNGVNIEKTVALEKADTQFTCSVSEWLETISSQSSGVRNTIYSMVSDWDSCKASAITGDVVQALVTKDYQGTDLVNYTEHTYNNGNDSGFTHLIGMANSVTADDLAAVRNVINTDFYSEDSHGADYWLRTQNTFSDDLSEPTQILTSHNSKGEWSRETTYHNGTYKSECGDSENSLSEYQCTK